MTMRCAAAAACLILVTAAPSPAQTEIKGALPSTITPPWNKGIQAINQENYWNAVACGKQGGARPLCVFYDADVCKNDDYEVAMYTPYKMVAYAVWTAVRAKQEPPTPSYAEAQRQRVIVKLTPKPAAKNPLTGIAIKRGGKTIDPVSKSLDAGVGNYIFDYATFAPTSGITIDMIGRTRTVSCQVDQATLALFR